MQPVHDHDQVHIHDKEHEHVYQHTETKFITGLAYVMMAFFGYSTVVALVFLVVFLFKPPLQLLALLDSYTGILRFIPPALNSLLEKNYLVFALFSFVFSGLNLSASIAFLKRRNWGRVYIIVLMIVTMIAAVLQLFFHHSFMLAVPTGEDVIIQDVLTAVNRLIHTCLIVFAALIVSLHGWIVWKLLSENIKKEFEYDR